MSASIKASIFCQFLRASKIPRGFLARAFQNFVDKKASKTSRGNFHQHRPSVLVKHYSYMYTCGIVSPLLKVRNGDI